MERNTSLPENSPAENGASAEQAGGRLGQLIESGFIDASGALTDVAQRYLSDFVHQNGDAAKRRAEAGIGYMPVGAGVMIRHTYGRLMINTNAVTTRAVEEVYKFCESDKESRDSGSWQRKMLGVGSGSVLAAATSANLMPGNVFAAAAMGVAGGVAGLLPDRILQNKDKARLEWVVESIRTLSMVADHDPEHRITVEHTHLLPDSSYDDYKLAKKIWTHGCGHSGRFPCEHNLTEIDEGLLIIGPHIVSRAQRSERFRSEIGMPTFAGVAEFMKDLFIHGDYYDIVQLVELARTRQDLLADIRELQYESEAASARMDMGVPLKTDGALLPDWQKLDKARKEYCNWAWWQIENQQRALEVERLKTGTIRERLGASAIGAIMVIDRKLEKLELKGQGFLRISQERTPIDDIDTTYIQLWKQLLESAASSDSDSMVKLQGMLETMISDPQYAKGSDEARAFHDAVFAAGMRTLEEGDDRSLEDAIRIVREGCAILSRLEGMTTSRVTPMDIYRQFWQRSQQYAQLPHPDSLAG